MRLSNAGVQDFDIHKAMAQEWHDLSDEGQRPYFEIYEQRKEVWEEDMEDFKRRGLVVGGVGAGPVGMLGGGVVEGVRDGGERERMDLGAEGLGEEIGPGEGEGGDEGENGGGDVEMGDGGGFTAVNR